MRVPLPIFVVLVVAVLAGCGPRASDAHRPQPAPKATQPDTESHHPTATSLPAATAPPSPADPTSPRQPAAPAVAPPPDLPTHFAELGDACPSRPTAMCVVCNGDQRVVAVYQPGDFLRVDDGDAVVSRSPQSANFEPRRLDWTIAVTDRLVSAQVLTCPGCRRQLGWAVMVDLAGLASADPAVRRELQAALGWPGDPLLHDAAAWRASTPSAPDRRGLVRDCPGGVIQAAAR